MQIIILHGEDTLRSYERLTRFTGVARRRGWEVLYDDLSVTLSLFGAERLIVVKDVKLVNPKILKVLDKIKGTVVIYYEGDLPASSLKMFPPATKIEKFEVPKIIWKFLDNITVKSLHEVIKTEPIEFVFVMIAWKFRKKYTAHPTAEVAQIIHELARIDVEAKTGKADLLLSLDLLLARNIQ